jgi:peptidoglycan/xylan/chitin deacetylase (PgdA/CDA1 family)
MCSRLSIAAVAFLVLSIPWARAQHRSVAITVDDLPYASGDPPEATPNDLRIAAVNANGRLLAAFRRHHIPVTGLVIQKGVEGIGSRTGTEILRQWVAAGFDLGNHTYSHLDFNSLSIDEEKEEIEKGETTIRPLMQKAGKPVTYFRFPMNHTGDTADKHDAIAAFLAQRRYQVATCTIDNSDYLFNAAYVRMLATGDAASASRLRSAYVEYTSLEIDYYAGLNKQVLGYEPPQVMLLHDSHLNADVIDQVLALFNQKHYTFVSLKTAQSDTAYRIADTYVTKFGPMWGYRWAKERHVKVDGRLEPDPPQWVIDYSKEVATVPAPVQ